MGTAIPALIAVRDGVSLQSCTVLDVSQGGCHVRLDADVPLPDNFFLLFTRAGSVRRACRVIWRHDTYLGLAFSGRFESSIS